MANHYPWPTQRAQMKADFADDDFDVVWLLHGPRALHLLGLWVHGREHFMGISNDRAVLYDSEAPHSLLGTCFWRGSTSELEVEPGLMFVGLNVPDLDTKLFTMRGLSRSSGAKPLMRRIRRS